MNKIVCALILLPWLVFGQSFHPAPGSVGSIAIHKDSSCFVTWATGGTVQRGFIQITDTTLTANNQNRASYGDLNLAFGPATGDVSDIVSLGDSGVATLTFDYLLVDGPGYDFAIFENGFANNYMEFAHVEVSSDGVHFFRFPSTTEVPLSPQITNASFSDCRMVNNLAGKYKIGFGTPFDLSEILDQPFFERNNIHFVRVVDAIGNVSGISTTDQFGTVINDPFPTPFESGGFDLEAIGLIHTSLPLSVSTSEITRIAFPNPATSALHVTAASGLEYVIMDQTGKKLVSGVVDSSEIIAVDQLQPGSYLLIVYEKTMGISRIAFTKI